MALEMSESLVNAVKKQISSTVSFDFGTVGEVHLIVSTR